MLQGTLLAGAGSIAAVSGRPARASRASVEFEDTSTSILALRGPSVELVTHGLTSVRAAAGARLGACVVLPGAGPQASGKQALVQRVNSIAIAGSDGELGRLEAEPGVANGVRRMLGAFKVPRPPSLFGFASGRLEHALEPGQPLQLSWRAELRDDDASTASLETYLGTFHAWVVGVLAEDLTFGGPLTYVPIDQVKI